MKLAVFVFLGLFLGLNIAQAATSNTINNSGLQTQHHEKESNN